ncbi:MBL fold metallo-hydrolase [Natronoglycomyces albus]|uniref:MBL fold metallo-hydrolase n=1 Tax=Natronoglycomyces albus TaxID=2811108 RepID=A0A895XGI4_9ACTN|nr:MBL fold metallo-hydrolase [Natronoglycomyces albus]QSB03987.1 MBL fold metallo-hydrolase [Natronoglycomyces albus]
MEKDNPWRSLAPGVWVRRWHRLDLNLGLVVGNERCLVIDTGCDLNDGRQLAEEIRNITDLPWQVAYTHDHFDHFFGTAAFSDVQAVWAAASAEAFTVSAEIARTHWAANFDRQERPDLAAALRETPLVVPDRLLTEDTHLDLGGRTVTLRHPGRGHTACDLIVEVPPMGERMSNTSATSVVFVGDLVENGAPPQFGDAFVHEWPATVASTLRSRPTIVVPGHGEPTDLAWALAQQSDLKRIGDLCEQIRDGLLSVEEAIPASPWDEPTLRQALSRLD